MGSSGIQAAGTDRSGTTGMRACSGPSICGGWSRRGSGWAGPTRGPRPGRPRRPRRRPGSPRRRRRRGTPGSGSSPAPPTARSRRWGSSCLYTVVVAIILAPRRTPPDLQPQPQGGARMGELQCLLHPAVRLSVASKLFRRRPPSSASPWSDRRYASVPFLSLPLTSLI